jgi:transcriptional regulator with XRE-family HTH domain
MTGSELKSKRSDLGWSQVKMADYLGINRSTLWRWEEGVVPVPKSVELALTAHTEKT